MTDATWRASLREAAGRILDFLSSRLPILVTFGLLLLLNWGTAIWLLHYLYQQRETTAFQLVNDELKYSEQKIAGLFRAADRTLLELRALYPGEGLSGDSPRLELGGWTRNKRARGA